MQRKALVRATAGFCGAAIVSVAGTAGAFENDILVAIAPGDLVAVTLNSQSTVDMTTDGAVSMQTSAPFCVPQPAAPCFYTLNYLKLRIGDFQADTNKGTYNFEDTYALMRGPLPLVDTGNGLVIQKGTPVEVGATMSGPDIPTGLETATNMLGAALTLTVSPINGEFTIDGTLPFSFFISQINEQFTGSIAGMIAGQAPFTNTAPFASAGPNINVSCPQAVPLGVFDTSDFENNIDQYVWNFSGPVAEQTLFGPTQSVLFGVGTTVATLDVVDDFGGVGVAQTTITVGLPPPAFATAPSTIVVSGCSSAASAIPVPVPSATVCGANVMVTGTVTSFNGASTSIPVVNGTVNVPPGTGSITFSASNASGTSTLTQTLTVLPPASFYGSHGGMVDDGSTVNGTVYAESGGQLTLQDDAVTGAVASLSPVLLQDRVTAPSIDTNAGLTFGHTDHIGSTSAVTPLLPPFPALSPVFTGTQTVTVNPSPETGDVVSIAPGEYGAVTVYSRGQLILSAGTYDFVSLDLEPQGQLVVPSTSAESVRVFVKNSIIYRGSVVVASGALAPIYLGYTGTADLDIQSPPFTGSIIAPNASLNLQSLNGTGVYTGEFFGKQVNLSPHTTVVADPFSCTASCITGCP